MPVKPRAGPRMGVAHEIRSASPAACSPTKMDIYQIITIPGQMSSGRRQKVLEKLRYTNEWSQKGNAYLCHAESNCEGTSRDQGMS